MTDFTADLAAPVGVAALAYAQARRDADKAENAHKDAHNACFSVYSNATASERNTLACALREARLDCILTNAVRVDALTALGDTVYAAYAAFKDSR